MRRPKYSDCMDENDEFDSECFEEAMSQYEDEERDRYLEEQCERIDERERMADYSDQKDKDEK